MPATKAAVKKEAAPAPKAMPKVKPAAAKAAEAKKTPVKVPGKNMIIMM